MNAHSIKHKEDRTILIHTDVPERNDTLGGRISLARDSADLSIAQAARRLGVMTASWHAWECDRDEPRANRLTMMAGLLGVSPSWLLTGLGDGPVKNTNNNITALLRELGRASEDAAAMNKRVQRIAAKIQCIRHPDEDPAAA